MNRNYTWSSRIKSNYFYILIFTILLPTIVTGSDTDIRVLSWWDYISPNVTKKIRSKFPRLIVTEYRSNEIALSKLLNQQDEYDVAIISNWVAEKIRKSETIETPATKKIINSRNYIKQILSESYCIPYLWSVSSFAYNSKEVSKISGINHLVRYINEAKKIGIIDDIMEFYTRISIDHKCEQDIKSCIKKINPISRNIKNDNFHSSLTDDLQEYDAVYSWHGVISETIEKIPNYSFSLPKTSPVIGGDYVCIIKNKNRSKKKLKKLVSLVEFLTNKENTNENVKSTFYFSPYKDFSPNILPSKTKRLYKDLQKLMDKSSPVFIKNYSKNEIDEINKFWKSVRFRK